MSRWKYTNVHILFPCGLRGLCTGTLFLKTILQLRENKCTGIEPESSRLVADHSANEIPA